MVDCGDVVIVSLAHIGWAFAKGNNDAQFINISDNAAIDITNILKKNFFLIFGLLISLFSVYDLLLFIVASCDAPLPVNVPV